MDARSCMEKMKSVGTLTMATVDENGAPQIRCVSAVRYAEDGLYFFTALAHLFAPTKQSRASSAGWRIMGTGKVGELHV